MVGIEISTFGAMVGSFDREIEERTAYLAESIHISRASSPRGNASRAPR